MRELDPKEVYRYLGYRGITPDEAVKEETAVCIREILEVSEPRASVRKVHLSFSGEEEGIVRLGSLEVQSRSLYRHLSGCSEACLFAATIGIGVDRLIRRAEVARMSKAAILQAAGAAAVEAWCDELNERVQREAAEAGKHTVKRFSPGYGDCPLSIQPAFLQLLDAAKEAGITLTEGCLMIPSKSVTAIIGIADGKEEGDPLCTRDTGCADCPLKDCIARK